MLILGTRDRKIIAAGRPGFADTMGVMDRDCGVCHQPIQEQDGGSRFMTNMSIFRALKNI